MAIGRRLLKIVKFDKNKQQETQVKKPPRTKTNRELRSREYLTEQEILTLIKTVRKRSRNALRDESLITVMFRHGLRVSEAVNLKWENVDFDNGLLHVSRIKNGRDSIHPIPGSEMRLLRRLERKLPKQRYVFVSERKGPISIITVHKMVKSMGERSGLKLSIHPHMLRHACGFYLANNGVDTRTIQLYLGHANIANTVIYTQLNAKAFNGFWKD